MISVAGLKRFWEKYGYLLAAILVPYILFFHVLIYGIIPTGSMEPTYMAGSVCLGSRLAYNFSDVQRGDIIIFRKERKQMVKRVVGMPGDKVLLSGGEVFINGAVLDEAAYLPNGTETFAAAGRASEFDVPVGCYFVLGDNRGNSGDSREWADFPFVPEGAIVGKVWGAVEVPFLNR